MPKGGEKHDGATFSSLELKSIAPPSYEESIKGKLNDVVINECKYSQAELYMFTFYAIVEQTLVEPIAEIPLSRVHLFVVPCDTEELCDNACAPFSAYAHLMKNSQGLFVLKDFFHS